MVAGFFSGLGLESAIAELEEALKCNAISVYCVLQICGGLNPKGKAIEPHGPAATSLFGD